MKIRKTLRNQIIMLLVAAVLTPIAALTGYSLYSTNKSLNAQYKDRTKSLKAMAGVVIK